MYIVIIVTNLNMPYVTESYKTQT